MLRGAYSHINNFSKFILLVVLVFSFLLFSSLLGVIILVPFYGSGVIDLLASPEYSNANVVNALKVLQILNMVGGLLLPALIYMWLCSPGSSGYARFDKSIPLITLLLSCLLILLAQPVIGWTNELNSYLVLPHWLSFLEEWMKRTELQGALITEAFLSTTTVNGLLVNIFMIALLPAFAEEILFRGAIASLLKDATKNVHLAVFFSSFIFAAIHLQFYGFLPRFLLGMALGYMFFWSGSLWLPIIAHFTNNFLSVVVEFLFRRGYIHTNAENFGMDNTIWITLISVICVSVILYFIHNMTMNRNRGQNTFDRI